MLPAAERAVVWAILVAAAFSAGHLFAEVAPHVRPSTCDDNRVTTPTWQALARWYARGSVISTIIAVPESAIFFTFNGVGTDSGGFVTNVLGRSLAVAAFCAVTSLLAVPALHYWSRVSLRLLAFKRSGLTHSLSLALLGAICGTLMAVIIILASNTGHFEVLSLQSFTRDLRLAVQFVVYVSLATVFSRRFRKLRNHTEARQPGHIA